MADHRRTQDRSSESYRMVKSPTFELDLAANLQLLTLLDPIDDSKPQAPADDTLDNTTVELRRMLSVNTVVSTSSSNAQRHTAAQEFDTENWRKIGAGACGAIFAPDGKSQIVKISKQTNTELWNDFIQHNRISESIKKYSIPVKIPLCHGYFPKNDEFLSLHPRLREVVETVCNLPASTLVAERILPLPKPVRNALIEKYAAPKAKTPASQDQSNKDCLVRLYLGSPQQQSPRMFFSLRNFKLHLHQMVEMQLDVGSIASAMAETLAVIHWDAGTDGRDIEFVLGSCSVLQTPNIKELEKVPEETLVGPNSRALGDFYHREIKLWCLDFNQVRIITFDKAGVEAAVEAFKLNDPYFPRPLQQTQIAKQLWNIFVHDYLILSDKILQHERKEVRALPRLFLRGVIEMEKMKQSLQGTAN